MKDETRNLARTQSYRELFTLEGFRYYYTIHRHPEPAMAPIVFVGGAFQDVSSWKKFIEYFSKITTVVAVDLPGSGISDELPVDYDFEYISEAIAKLLDAENLDKVYIFSASYGALVAYQFARRHTNRLERLIMAGVMQTVPEATRDNMFASVKAVEDNDIERFIDIVLNGMISSHVQLDRKKRDFTRKVLARQLSHISSEQKSKFLANSKRVLGTGSLEIGHLTDIDTLIFTGEFDDFTNIDDCREFARRIGNASFLTIDQADHLCHLQQFHVVTNIIENYGYGRGLDSMQGCSNYERFA